ncbi:hypothetical protein ScPMuIL_004629 [Solemya velum]
MNAADDWTTEEVCEWLNEHGFSQYSDLLCAQHRIDGPVLLTLTEHDLRQPPLQIPILGDIKRLIICIDSLKDPQGLNTFIPNGALSLNSSRFVNKARRRGKFDSESVTDDEEEDLVDTSDKKRHSVHLSRNLDPEIWKTFLSFVYVFCVFLLTAFVMVIVHDRVPDMEKYPPLPDIFLDNLPYIPWAFQVCEIVGVLLFSIWSSILFFHKHRFILMRRMFSLTGTVFLLRCFTMLITSLSVPGMHLQCSGKMYGDTWVKLRRTLEIWMGFGMTLQGVRTCGDYMFSGHTVIITILNFFITEYTSRRQIYFLHTFTWVLNVFGIFFILAAHEHYSIDVFIAFYITSRLFLYYHTLANNRSLMLRDKKRTQVWFPLFSFFESKCDSIVPNEYEWPFRYPKSFIKFFEGKRK